MPSQFDDPADGADDAAGATSDISSATSLFDEIAPFRLAIGVVFVAFVVYAVVSGWISATSPDAIGVALLCLVFLSGGFVPFNSTLAYYVSQSAAFMLWGVLRLLFGGIDLVPMILGVFGAVGVVIYGRRALSDGLRAQV
ncbi:hypothetical protein [Haloferax sp. DFSO52]|uniref:hypothetical protein n=1 Tax=Haloferax sp. DFSO52 TaxID=3388505 RepID=UPI003A89C894